MIGILIEKILFRLWNREQDMDIVAKGALRYKGLILKAVLYSLKDYVTINKIYLYL